MKVRKFAAIDIGSNAVRLLVHNVIEEPEVAPQFRKSSLFRIPVRLGADAFTTGYISEHNVNRMLQTMQAFKLLMDVIGVEKYLACATSAMREASNGSKIVAKIAEETGVKVTLIDGQREAEIIASTDLKTLLQKGQAYLYIDVGGGSTEFTLFSESSLVTSKSFKIGTVRLINNMVSEGVWDEIQEWVTQHTTHLTKIEIIGSGGNINKLHKMSGSREGEPLSYIWINSYYHFLSTMSYEERIAELGLNPDRADVIIPATRIYLLAAKWSGAKKIHVPKIGLADGMIKTLYYEEGKN